MSEKSEDCMRRCVQSAGYAARSCDPELRELYKRMAQRWFRRAVEEKTRVARRALTYVKAHHVRAS